MLDTKHLAELEENSVAGRLLRTRLKNQTTPLATTISTVEEHLRGWCTSLNRSNDPDWQIPVYARLQKQVDLFAHWPVLPFVQEAATLLRQFQKRRIRIGTMDLKIACIAVTHDATLLTRNTVDFALVPGLRFENWLDLEYSFQMFGEFFGCDPQLRVFLDDFDPHLSDFGPAVPGGVGPLEVF